MRIQAKSDVGLVRTSNQDAFAYGDFSDGTVWAVVCDGMGGANGGQIASTMAVDMISSRLKSQYREHAGKNIVRNMLVCACEAANATVFAKSEEDEELKGMGTTAIAAVISKDTLHILHIGDSRVYLIRGGKIVRLTKDHSIVQELVETGQITEDEAKQHPQKNVITKALGVRGILDYDYIEEPILEEDRILLCTDGLSNSLEEEEILRLSQKDDAIDEMIRQAKEYGGSDNITIVQMENN